MEGKKSRINEIDLVDRISNLPDFILGHILSFLCTKKAVSTSILSKRWKFAWVSLHSLDFCNPTKNSFIDYMKEKEDILDFVQFVNRVLLLNYAGSLNKFSLTCSPRYFAPQIISWINTTITRNVHHLYLCVGNIDIPASLFICDSLRSLVLYGNTCIYDTSAVYLPRLESLKMDCVCFESEEACEKLLSGCPILHYLKLFINYKEFDDDADDDTDHYIDDVCNCVISSASLRHVDICFGDRGRVKLKASSLEYLTLGGCIFGISVEKSLSSLVEADFSISLPEHDSLPLDGHDFLNNSIVEAVRAFNCAKSLTLSADVLRALSRATISLSAEFASLVKLKAYRYFSSLPYFIQSSSNLEALLIYKDSFLFTSDPHDHPNWTAPVEVPGCLSKSLKKVLFDGYNGGEDNREMIRYMLMHGSVLEVMQISCSANMGDREKLELLQEILDFPKKSPACKVQLCTWPSKTQFELLD